MAGDWKDIQNDREKYAAYLCSREWAVLKEAVHERARGICERCLILPIDSVHHLTYERKYREDLSDLEGHCETCHAFTHGKSDFDPSSVPSSMQGYFRACRTFNLVPAPTTVVADCFEIKQHWRVLRHAMRVLRSIQSMTYHPVDLSDAASLLNSRIPFDLQYLDIWHHDFAGWNYCDYDRIRSLLKCQSFVDTELVDDPSDVTPEE